ncbi:protein kinase [Myxococcaceae bacterium GXIMD 01537]
MQLQAWRILRKLGEGGYGYVFLVELAEEPRGGFFTLKLAKFRQGEAGARADKERILLTRVDHPNIVRVWGHGYWPHPCRGWPYLIMEYVEGPALWHWLESHNPTLREVVGVMAAVADALAAVHEKGALHRDIKGENILIRSSDGQPMLLDFGVGDYEESETVTLAALPPGTAHYRSPESLRFLREHREAKARYEFRPTDELYAFGVMLSRMLTGEFPFSPSLPPDLLYAEIEHRAPTPPTQLNPRVPKALNDLTMGLLAKHPEQRPSSARALHERLIALSGEEERGWEQPLFERIKERHGTEGIAPQLVRPEHAPQLGRNPEPPMAARTQAVPPRSPSMRTLEGPPSLQSLAASTRHPSKLLAAGGVLAALVWAFSNARTASSEPAAPQRAATVPARPSPEPTSSSVPSHHEPSPLATHLPQESAPSMNLTSTSQRPPATQKLSHSLRGPCFAIAASASMATGCAGVPTLPPRLTPCPEKTVAAMERRGIALYEPMGIYFDATHADEIEKGMAGRGFNADPYLKIYENGPVVGRIEDPEFSQAPKGTLLYGYLWTNAHESYAIIYFNEAVYPDGKREPICMHTLSSGSMKGGWPLGTAKNPASTLKAAILFPKTGGVFVRSYP